MCQDKILIAGGTEHDWGTGLDAVEIFDTKSFIYSAAPSMPIKCFGSTSVSLGKHMIVAGGIEKFHQYKSLDGAQVFDCESQIWKVLPSKMNTGRALHAGALLRRNHLVIAGGGTIRSASHKCCSRRHFTTAEKIVLPLYWSLKGQLIILRCLVVKNRALCHDGTRVEKDSAACKKLTSADRLNGHSLRYTVKTLASNDFPFDVFKVIVHFL